MTAGELRRQLDGLRAALCFETDDLTVAVRIRDAIRMLDGIRSALLREDLGL